MPERFVAWLWEHGHAGRHLSTIDGRPVAVIYPGRRWGSWGPDFRGALLAVDGAILRGDVEVHVHARDWDAHGHGRDPAYAATVLHVVLEPSGTGSCPLPTVALAPFLSQALPLLFRQWLSSGSSRPEAVPCRSPQEAAPLLEKAGLVRLEGKAARFESDLACRDPLEALLGGIVEGLGYASNVAPFRRWLERVPIGQALGLAHTEGPITLLAVLLGEAGLLASQRGLLPLDDYTDDLEQRWRARSQRDPWQGLGWRWVGARPANSPVRRVAAAAALLADPLTRDLPGAVLTALSELPPHRACTALRSLLLRAGDPYWQRHYDLGRSLARPAALLGSARSADAVVNAVLPWALALTRVQGNQALEDAALAAYSAHPPLSDNQITRHMAFQVLGDEARQVVTTARRQQGLLHLYHHWCEGRDCPACPAGGGFQVRAL